MFIQIKRKDLGKTCVQGTLKVYEDKADCLKGRKCFFECLTLEEDKEGTRPNQDLRIPPGFYKLKRHSPSRFESGLRKLTEDNEAQMLCVYNEEVKASRCILIHWGNTDRDTEGCILLGFSKLNDETIGQSKNACKEFYKMMKEVDLRTVRLEIVNAFKKENK